MQDRAEPVGVETVEDVAVVRVDDGKANAITHDIVDGVHAALERAEDEARAVLLVGREGRFSAGFDLGVMAGDDPDAAKELLRAGAELALRLYTHPQPVIIACTGHALAMGAILLMAGDTRYGASGDFKIGTNEVRIGMQLPRFACELARDRLSRRHFHAATHQAVIYDPDGAVDAGFLDAAVTAGDLYDTSFAHAARAAADLHPTAFRRTRDHVRSAVAEAVAAGLDADMAEF